MGGRVKAERYRHPVLAAARRSVGALSAQNSELSTKRTSRKHEP